MFGLIYESGTISKQCAIQATKLQFSKLELSAPTIFTKLVQLITLTNYICTKWEKIQIRSLIKPTIYVEPN